MDTRGIIIKALVRLMNKKDIEKISVQEILDEAHVSRRTFYLHFQDKYDAVNQYLTYQMTDVILTKFDGTNWNEIIISLYRFIRDNASYFSATTRSTSPESFYRYLKKWFLRKIKGFYETNSGKPMEAFSREENLIMELYATGLLAFAEKLILHPSDYTDEDIAECTEILLNEIPDVYHKL